MSHLRIAIIGGAGFIGSHVNKYLSLAGYQTTVFDNLSQGDRRAVSYGHFLEGDIASSADLNHLFALGPFDVVLHLAALIQVGDSIKDPAKYYKNNVANTLLLLDTMQQHGCKRLVFSSSAAVYGLPYTQTISEEHACQPINPYGETKWMVEKILRDYDRAYGLRSIALRYFNAAGGDPQGELKTYSQTDSNLIPIILRTLLKGKGELTIFGTDYPTPDGTCVRDYIHVWDLAKAHELATQQLIKHNKSTIYNLGNGLGFSVREVAAAVQRVTQLPLEITEGMRRPGDPPFLIANATKAHQELDWYPTYPAIDTIVADAWRAFH